MSGSPIVPYHAVANREWTLTSWDKHRIPKPFSRVIISVGTPYQVDKQLLKEDEADVLKKVSNLMQKNVERAEQEIESL